LEYQFDLLTIKKSLVICIHRAYDGLLFALRGTHWGFESSMLPTNLYIPVNDIKDDEDRKPSNNLIELRNYDAIKTGR